MKKVLAGLMALGMMLGMGSTADAQPPGQVCQDWRNLRGAGGETFRNQGQCASYVARGGVVSTPAPLVLRVEETWGSVYDVSGTDIADAIDSTWRLLLRGGVGTLHWTTERHIIRQVPGGPVVVESVLRNTFTTIAPLGPLGLLSGNTCVLNRTTGVITGNYMARVTVIDDAGSVGTWVAPSAEFCPLR